MGRRNGDIHSFCCGMIETSRAVFHREGKATGLEAARRLSLYFYWSRFNLEVWRGLSDRPPGAVGSPPAGRSRKAGTDRGTTVVRPWHERIPEGHSGSSGVDGVPREAREG
jgi:hypothetical protein